MHEFTLLQRVFARNAELPASVIVPPGDDMAMMMLSPSHALLAACDSAIEGVHAPMGCDARVLGRKAVLRNLSDVAAMMNARPIATLACVTLPRDCDDARAWQLFEGLRETAAAWGAPLIGGDVSKMSASTTHAPIIASVTILAVRIDETRAVVTRCSARVGDNIYVTGTIGGAWDAVTGLGRHLNFTPRIKVAQTLHALLGDALGAAIDVSDGLGRDLGHIATQSRVRLEIDLARVPICAGSTAREAIAHGEDYELAFTARGEVPSEVDGVAITLVGRVVEGEPAVIALVAGESFVIAQCGYEHRTTDGGRA